MGISLLLRKRKAASQVRVKVTIICASLWPVVEIQMERLFGAFFLQLCHPWKWQVYYLLQVSASHCWGEKLECKN